MSKVDMEPFGLPGITYHFAGKTRYFQKKDGAKIQCKSLPWDIKVEERGNFAIFCEVTLDKLSEAFVSLSDTMSEQARKTQVGTAKAVEINWDNIVEYNEKGIPVKLNYSNIGKLMASEYIKVDNMLMKMTSNIAKPVSKESLTIDVIGHLEAVQSANLWTTTSCSLVKDHILASCETKKAGKNSGFLPVKNGVLDLAEMKLIQTDEIYMSSVSVEYDPKATCPSIMQLLDNAFLPEQKELVLSILGAAISGRRAPFILCLSGQGRNGKSVVRELVRQLLDDLYTSDRIENLTEKFSNQGFIGRRVIWQTEVSSKRQFTDKLKDITGGTTLSVQYKFENGQFQYDLQGVVVLDTNHPPALENSVAIEDRLRFIDMPNHFVYELSGADHEVLIDQSLLDKANNELPGFLNLLAEYAHYFICNGRLKFDIKGSMEIYNDKADSLGKFIAEWCDCEEYDKVSIQTFCKYYKLYAQKANVAALTDSQIRYQLKHEFNLNVKGMTVWGVRPKVQQIVSSVQEEM